MKFRHLKSAFLMFGAVLLVNSCANRAQGPTGGPKDVMPPRVMRSIPENNSLNFDKKQVMIEFDENISIDKPMDNVIISPPQVKPPDVKSYGRRLTVVFNEELKDTTTYSINFGNAIVDLNEKNPIKNYLFSFSTGEQIDTLRVSGTVLDAGNLNPLAGVVVGVYVENSDSVFYKKPFLRIGRTDENGHFSIDNMKKGKYRVFALGDANRDYFCQPGEGLAMLDSLVSPFSRRELMRDSVWKDSVHLDSVRTYMGTRFLPDDLVLRFFKEDKKRQYFLKYERKDAFSFKLFFNAPSKELPEVKPLNFNWDGKHMVQKNNTLDSLTYWLTDSTVWKQDTLKLALTYQKSDSLLNLVRSTDTVSVIWRKPQLSAKARNAKARQKAEPFKFNNNISSTCEIYNPLVLHFEAPVADFDLSKIILSQLVDTVYKPIPFKWKQVDSTRTVFAVENKWLPENSYELKIDSAAFRSIYSRVSNKFSSEFKIRSLDEYSGVKVYISPFNAKVMLQVLNTQDVVLATKPASAKGTLFEYLKPGDYYVRMFIDSNGNGKWDPGDLAQRRQPEEVFYYNKKFTLKANWEFEETWNYLTVPVLQQKPTELKKSAANKRESYD